MTNNLYPLDITIRNVLGLIDPYIFVMELLPQFSAKLAYDDGAVTLDSLEGWHVLVLL